MRVPREVVEQIRERVVLSELIGEYVRLVRDGGGGRSKGLCPFHSERTPSFNVNDDERFYFCFGCQASGDAFRFLMSHTGVGFMEALEQLALRTGVDLPKHDDGTRDNYAQDREGKEAYHRVMSSANSFFMAQLAGEDGEQARQYLKERGIDEETALRFQLGYAPDSWGAMVDVLTRQSIPPGYLLRAGLARQRDGQDGRSRDGIYDAFRHRIMFPILEINGKPIAFSGRALSPEDRAKYINSPETKFYTKGQNLYGVHAARRAIRARDQVVLVEGNFDVVSLHAHGIDEVVAPLGTALTPRQAEILSRFSKRVILAFDGDRAGRTAARRAFEVLLEAGVDDVRWLIFQEDEDPDSFVRAHGGEKLRERVNAAPMMMEQVIDEALAGTLKNNDPTIRRQAMHEAAEWIRRLRDPFVAQEWREEVARRLQASTAVIQQAETAARQRATRQAHSPEAEENVAMEVLELTRHEQALVLALNEKPARLERILRQQLYRVMLTPRFGNSLEKLARAWSEGALDFLVLIEELTDRGVSAAILGVLARKDLKVSTDDAGFETLLREFQIRWVRARSKEIELEVSRCHREGDHLRVSELLGELERLHRYLENA